MSDLGNESLIFVHIPQIRALGPRLKHFIENSFSQRCPVLTCQYQIILQ